MKEIKITDTIVIYNDVPRGWSQGKLQPSWHRKVYDMWRDMWRRVYTRLDWFGSLTHPSFQYLSNFVTWIESQPNFDEFCSTCDRVRWGIDKDTKHPGNRDYYPEYMILTTQSDNTKERNNRRGNPMPKKPLLGIPLDNTNKIILTMSTLDVTKYGFHQGNVSSCLAKRYKTHKGYKWYYINYKHNKIYRRVQ